MDQLIEIAYRKQLVIGYFHFWFYIYSFLSCSSVFNILAFDMLLDKDIKLVPMGLLYTIIEQDTLSCPCFYPLKNISFLTSPYLRAPLPLDKNS